MWDPARADYPWMTAELAPIRRRFDVADLRPELERAGIARTILVQTRASRDETREFLHTAAGTEFIAGVVGWIDLTSTAVADDIAALRALPGGAKLAGVRHQVHDEPDPAWLLRADVLRGIAVVRDAGLTFDLLVRTRELPAAIAVARRFPELRVVLDHCAKPPVAGGAIPSQWETGIAALAALPNVWCKLSGLVTEADWQRWTVADLQPYVARIAAAFAPDRLMFGSDWPVCLLAASYQSVVETARTLVAETIAAEAARSAIFGANAAAAYRLPAAGMSS